MQPSRDVPSVMPDDKVSETPNDSKTLLVRLRPGLAYLLNPFAETKRSIKKPLAVMALAIVLACIVMGTAGNALVNHLLGLDVVLVESSGASLRPSYATMATGLTSWTACFYGLGDCLFNIALLCAATVLMLILRDRRPGTVMSCEGRFRWRVALMAWPAIIPILACVGLPLIEHRSDIVLTSINPLPALIYLSYMGVTIAFEDLVFRGYLRQVIFAWVGNRKGMRDSLYGQRTAMVVSSILATLAFAVGHPYDILGLVFVITFGLLSCWMTDLTGGLEIPILVHIGWDFAIEIADAIMPEVILAGTSSTVAETIDSLILTVLLFTLPAMLYVRKHRKDTDDALVTTIPDTPPTDRQARKRRTLVAASSVASAVCLVAYFLSVHTVNVHTETMEPALHVGDSCLMESQEQYGTGDIVIAYREKQEGKLIMALPYIRQVIGVEGDTVTVDGREVTLGRNEYLVAATNPDADDGDECNNVVVRAEEIDGRLAYRLPSFERIGD